MSRVVVPRTPPPGVTPSRSLAARVTVPVQPTIVAFVASLAVTVTVNAAPAAAEASAVTWKWSRRCVYVSRISLTVGVIWLSEVERETRKRIRPDATLTPERSAGGTTDVQLPPELREYS